MENPYKNIQLKNWPDFWLAITGVSFVILLLGMAAGRQFPGGTSYWLILFGGLVIFGIGAQKAHYRSHVNGIEGNMNVWVSKWKHSILADTFALVGVILVLYSVAHFMGYIEPNTALQPTSGRVAAFLG